MNQFCPILTPECISSLEDMRKRSSGTTRKAIIKAVEKRLDVFQQLVSIDPNNIDQLRNLVIQAKRMDAR